MKTVSNKLLLIQPGAFGDIFLCAPIAKFYSDKGYEVYWPVTKKFTSTLEYFPYVKPILLSDEILHKDWMRSDVMKILPHLHKYEKVINLADRGPHPTAQQYWENFEQCKYRLAEVPFSEKNNLSWQRKKNKEKELLKFLGLSDQDEYAVIHRVDSHNEAAEIPEINIKTVEIRELNGFNIPDWFTVIQKAKQIFCVESGIHQFIDGIAAKTTKEKFLLRKPCVPVNCRHTVSSSWKLDYVGKNSIVHG